MALRVLLGVASVGITVIGFVSGGPLGALWVAIGGIVLVVVIVIAARSGWMLSL